MKLAVGIQPSNGGKDCSYFLRAAQPFHQNPIFSTLKTPLFSFNPTRFDEVKLIPIKISASAATLAQGTSYDTNEAKEKLGVVVKPTESPRLVLKFIWMERNLGIANDQVIPGGHGTVPVSPYYFWPRKDAWEELRVMLESKPWISQKRMVILLNQATDIINLWQQTGGD